MAMRFMLNSLTMLRPSHYDFAFQYSSSVILFELSVGLTNYPQTFSPVTTNTASNHV